MTILALPNQPAALLAVTSGRAVGDLTDHSTASYIAKTTNSGNSFEVVADPAAPNGYDPQLVGIGIVATNTALLNTVQKALQDLIDRGRLPEDRRQVRPDAGHLGADQPRQQAHSYHQRQPLIS